MVLMNPKLLTVHDKHTRNPMKGQFKNEAEIKSLREKICFLLSLTQILKMKLDFSGAKRKA